MALSALTGQLRFRAAPLTAAQELLASREVERQLEAEAEAMDDARGWYEGEEEETLSRLLVRRVARAAIKATEVPKARRTEERWEAKPMEAAGAVGTAAGAPTSMAASRVASHVASRVASPTASAEASPKAASEAAPEAAAAAGGGPAVAGGQGRQAGAGDAHERSHPAGEEVIPLRPEPATEPRGVMKLPMTPLRAGVYTLHVQASPPLLDPLPTQIHPGIHPRIHPGIHSYCSPGPSADPDPPWDPP